MMLLRPTQQLFGRFLCLTCGVSRGLSDLSPKRAKLVINQQNGGPAQALYVGFPGGMPIRTPSARINSTGLLPPKPTRAKQTPRRPHSLGGRTTSGSLPKTRLTCSRARCCSLPSALGLNSLTLRVMPSKQQKLSHPVWCRWTIRRLYTVPSTPSISKSNF
jgi:hypothetical protein